MDVVGRGGRIAGRRYASDSAGLSAKNASEIIRLVRDKGAYAIQWTGKDGSQEDIHPGEPFASDDPAIQQWVSLWTTTPYALFRLSSALATGTATKYLVQRRPAAVIVPAGSHIEPDHAEPLVAHPLPLYGSPQHQVLVIRPTKAKLRITIGPEEYFVDVREPARVEGNIIQTALPPDDAHREVPFVAGPEAIITCPGLAGGWTGVLIPVHGSKRDRKRLTVPANADGRITIQPPSAGPARYNVRIYDEDQEIFDTVTWDQTPNLVSITRPDFQTTPINGTYPPSQLRLQTTGTMEVDAEGGTSRTTDGFDVPIEPADQREWVNVAFRQDGKALTRRFDISRSWWRKVPPADAPFACAAISLTDEDVRPTSMALLEIAIPRPLRGSRCQIRIGAGDPRTIIMGRQDATLRLPAFELAPTPQSNPSADGTFLLTVSWGDQTLEVARIEKTRPAPLAAVAPTPRQAPRASPPAPIMTRPVAVASRQSRTIRGTGQECLVYEPSAKPSDGFPVLIQNVGPASTQVSIERHPTRKNPYDMFPGEVLNINQHTPSAKPTSRIYLIIPDGTEAFVSHGGRFPDAPPAGDDSPDWHAARQLPNLAVEKIQ